MKTVSETFYVVGTRKYKNRNNAINATARLIVDSILQKSQTRTKKERAKCEGTGEWGSWHEYAAQLEQRARRRIVRYMK